MSEAAVDPYLPGHGDARYGVRRYELDLEYSVARNHLAGRAVLDVVAHEDLTALDLDLHALRVVSVEVRGAVVRRWSARSGRLGLRFASQVAAGTALRVAVRYQGTPRPVRAAVGEAGWEELADGAIVAAQPHGAPSWFPCNDRASDKATYLVAVTVDAGYVVVGNGVLRERASTGRRVRWVHEMDRPMSPYLATTQIGRYRPTTLTGRVPMTAHHPARLEDQVRATFARQGEMLDAFERWFGPYPFAGYDVVVTDDDLEIPLESQGLSTFGPNLLGTSWERQRLVAHELAHQWFGNAVTAASLADIWLHEGFACYAEWLWSQASGGTSTDELARTHHERLAGEPADLVLTDPGPGRVFDDRVYKRGALALHALRHDVGDVLFFDLLRAWVRRHRGGAVRTRDLLELAAEVVGRPVDDVLGPWLHEAALPQPPEPVGSSRWRLRRG